MAGKKLREFREKNDELNLIKKILDNGGVIKGSDIKLGCGCGKTEKTFSPEELVKNYLKKGFIKLECEECEKNLFSIKEVLYNAEKSEKCTICSVDIPKIIFKLEGLEIPYNKIHEFYEHPEEKISKNLKKLIELLS